MRKAILAVSYGTSYAEAEQSCIRPVEDALRAAYPECNVCSAFTSRIIIRKLRGQGTDIESPEEALARLTAERYEEIIVVPTHIIPGHEYEKVRTAANGYKISAPLLGDEADLDWMCELLASIADAEGRPLLVMGHGTDHAANDVYARLRKKLPGSVHLACVEGEHMLEKLLPHLHSLSEKRLTLMPLMLVAGSHALSSLAGDEQGSWKSILESNGFEVRIRMQGLGALPEVQQRFVEKAGRLLSQAELKLPEDK